MFGKYAADNMKKTIEIDGRNINYIMLYFVQ